MKKSLLFSLIILFSIMLGAQAPVKKELNPVEALQYLESKENEIEKLTKVKAEKGSAAFKGKEESIRKVVDTIMDYDYISRYVIGEKWDKSPEDKKKNLHQKLKELFTEFYLEEVFYNKSYEKKYIDKTVEAKYKKDIPKSVAITTELQVTLKKKPVVYEIVYHLHRPDTAKNYLIFDIELDGVSLIQNYRTQFTKNMKDSDLDAIIKKIENKLSSRKKK